jgi:anaerobic magnesium-protoporphyrin IX monomethyl ester cyclase
VRTLKILFIEPSKDFYFVMGESLPPPCGIIQLAAFLEKEVKNARIEILDCNAEQVDWREMEKRIESSNPDIVASSSLATCNTYTVARTLETAKKVNPNVLTITRGQQARVFSANKMKRMVFRHMAGRSLPEQFKSLFVGAST